MFIFVFPASGRGPGTVHLYRVKQLINGMPGATKDLWEFIGNIYNKIAKYRHICREKTSWKRPSGLNLKTVGPRKHFDYAFVPEYYGVQKKTENNTSAS